MPRSGPQSSIRAAQDAAAGAAVLPVHVGAGRKIGMSALHPYLAVAMILVIVQLAIGH